MAKIATSISAFEDMIGVVAVDVTIHKHLDILKLKEGAHNSKFMDFLINNGLD
jgi:hypothetical protein